MGVVVGIAALAGIIFAFWLWGKFTSALSTGVNRHVFQRGAHRTGQAVRDNPLHFETTGDKNQVRDWILAQLPLEPHRPRMLTALFVEGTDDMTTRLVIGSMVGGDDAVIDLDLDQRGPVTAGVLSLQRWSERDGVMVVAQRVADLYASVEQGVRRADPAARIFNPLAA